MNHVEEFQSNTRVTSRRIVWNNGKNHQINSTILHLVAGKKSQANNKRFIVWFLLVSELYVDAIRCFSFLFFLWRSQYLISNIVLSRNIQYDFSNCMCEFFTGAVIYIRFRDIRVMAEMFFGFIFVYGCDIHS